MRGLRGWTGDWTALNVLAEDPNGGVKILRQPWGGPGGGGRGCSKKVHYSSKQKTRRKELEKRLKRRKKRTIIDPN